MRDRPQRWTGPARAAAGVWLLILLGGGCASGGDDDAGDTGTATPAIQQTTTPEEEPPAETVGGGVVTEEQPSAASEEDATADTTENAVVTEVPAPSGTASPDDAADPLADTPVTAPLDQAFTFDGQPPAPETLPFEPGSVTARWYRAGDVLAVVYEGLEPDLGSCVGNSAFTGEVFEHLSNAVLADGACVEGDPVVTSDPTVGIQRCGDRIAYLTQIPSDTPATLLATVAVLDPAGGGVSITSAADGSIPDALPTVDPGTLAC